MTLRDLKPGETAKVVAINAEGAFKRRIMDMGITTGVSRASHRSDAGQTVR